MTADEVLRTVAAMPQADWIKTQTGIAEMLAAQFSPTEVAEIQSALDEADLEMARGEQLTGSEMRRHFGLP
jgi:deoxyribose-phosphate aldolase